MQKSRFFVLFIVLNLLLGGLTLTLSSVFSQEEPDPIEPDIVNPEPIVIPTLSPQNAPLISIPESQIQITAPDASDIYTIKFLTPDASLLTDEARQAIATALNEWNKQIPENNTFYLVGIRVESTWAVASMTSVNLESPSPMDFDAHTPFTEDNTFSVLVVNTLNGWQAALDSSESRLSLLEFISVDELSYESRSAIFGPESSPILIPQQQFNDYKFPWPSDRAWRRANGYIDAGIDLYGWHDSAGNGGGNALDFYPIGASNSDILAAAPGTIHMICTDGSNGASFFLMPDGTSENLIYVHLAANSLLVQNGSRVTQGQKLGRLHEGAIDDTCGIGNFTHLHLQFPSKPFTIDGKTFTSTYTYQDIDLYSTSKLHTA